MKTARSLFALCTATCLATIPFTIFAEPAATGNAGSVQKTEEPAQPSVPPGMLTAEQQEKQRAVMLEYRTRMDDLRDKMMQKQMELDYLAGNPNVKADEIKAIIADIVKLRKESRETGRELRAKLRENGLALFPPSGMQWPVQYGPNGYPGYVPRGRPFRTMPGAMPRPQGPWPDGYWQDRTPMPGMYWEDGQDGYAPAPEAMGN